MLRCAQELSQLSRANRLAAAAEARLITVPARVHPLVPWDSEQPRVSRAHRGGPLFSPHPLTRPIDPSEEVQPVLRAIPTLIARASASLSLSTSPPQPRLPAATSRHDDAVGTPSPWTGYYLRICTPEDPPPTLLTRLPTIRLPSQRATSFGSSNCDVTFSCDGIDDRHCEFEVLGSALRLRVIGRSGVWVNDVRVPPQEARQGIYLDRLDVISWPISAHPFVPSYVVCHTSSDTQTIDDLDMAGSDRRVHEIGSSQTNGATDDLLAAASSSTPSHANATIPRPLKRARSDGHPRAPHRSTRGRPLPLAVSTPPVTRSSQKRSLSGTGVATRSVRSRLEGRVSSNAEEVTGRAQRAKRKRRRSEERDETL